MTDEEALAELVHGLLSALRPTPPLPQDQLDALGELWRRTRRDLTMGDPLEVDRSAPPDYAEALFAIHTLQRQLGHMTFKDPQRGDVSFLGLYGEMLRHIEDHVEHQAVSAMGGQDVESPVASMRFMPEDLQRGARAAMEQHAAALERAGLPGALLGKSVPQSVIDLMEARAEDDGSNEDPGAYGL